MKPEDRWDLVRRWELEHDRSRLQHLSPEEKIRIYDEMYEEVRRLCPEKLGKKRLFRKLLLEDPGISKTLLAS